VHRKGTCRQVPDALSRINFLEASTTAETVANFEEPANEWYVERRKQEQDKWPDWRVEGNYLKLDQVEKVIEGTDRWKLVVRKDFREKVFKENHDLPTAGHLGITKTFLRIVQAYFWPGLFRDLVLYVKSCEVCQAHKVEQQVPRGKMGYRNKPVPG
jgi:hypothetical protein